MYEVCVHSSVGVPENVPVLVLNEIPDGSDVLFRAQEVMTPDPVIVGASGRFELAVLFVNVKFSGE